MKWTIEYFEQANTTQPAEVFEDALDATNIKLSGKLFQITNALQSYGPQLGGGYIEKCHVQEEKSQVPPSKDRGLVVGWHYTRLYKAST